MQPAGRLLWTVKDPGGYRTAHQPFPVDLDGDGRRKGNNSAIMLSVSRARLSMPETPAWVRRELTARLEALQNDPVALEKLAREELNMRRPDEEVLMVLPADPETP